MKVLAVASGGMDSTTLCYKLAADQMLEGVVSFDYGQRHRKELDCAARIASNLGVSHDVIDLSAVGKHLGGSALTDDIDVPDGHYAEDNMRITVVPNRNQIMLSIAAGIAVARRCDAVATAVHAGDHTIYPDCRTEFIESLDATTQLATESFGDVRVLAPFVTIDKTAIAQIGDELGVPWADTWTCYKGGDVHCGKCATCVERQEAMHLAGVHDPTEYADPLFWRTVTGV
jgi:7-cyano-7-deazaguanine synthase